MTAHPRPQLARAEWVDLTGEWEFEEDPADVGMRDRWYEPTGPINRRIVVPFPPESPASGIGSSVSDVIWYRRAVVAAPIEPGFRRILHFDAVDYLASVWVNGDAVAQHEGGQTGFRIDVTDAWTSEDAIITVRATDRAADIEQPRGKQDWLEEPHIIWYRRTSGIWGTVWYEDVPALHLAHLLITPTGEFGRVEVEAELEGSVGTDTTLELEFRLEGRVLARATHAILGDRLRASVVLEAPWLEPELTPLWWSPESPTLIQVTATLQAASGEAPDVVSSYFGFRTVGTDDRSFLLNGRPYFLRLVLEQGYWPDTHLAAPSDDELRREVELIKELGFNGVRMHQRVADPRFLYWCDVLGLVVWADSAAAYRFSARSLARTTAEWMSIVHRDRTHPSVVAWVPFNESWGVPAMPGNPRQRHAVAALYHLIKGLDGSRPVLGNDGWEFTVGDILGVHDYSHDPAVLASRYGTHADLTRHVEAGRVSGRRIVLESGGGPAVPVVLTEFGGFNLDADGTAWSGYGGIEGAPERALLDLFGAVGGRSGLAGFCYTQLTDTLQEQNGLLTDRRVPKLEIAAIRSAVRSGHAAR